MNKKEIINNIANGTGLSSNETTVVVDSFLRCITSALSNGVSVSLRGFGSFSIKQINERTYTTIHGNSITIPSHATPMFKASKFFIQQINND